MIKLIIITADNENVVVYLRLFLRAKISVEKLLNFKKDMENGVSM